MTMFLSFLWIISKIVLLSTSHLWIISEIVRLHRSVGYCQLNNP